MILFILGERDCKEERTDSNPSACLKGMCSWITCDGMQHRGVNEEMNVASENLNNVDMCALRNNQRDPGPWLASYMRIKTRGRTTFLSRGAGSRYAASAC